MSNARENVNLLTSADWDIAALRLANWGSGAVPPQVMLKQNYVAGDGGGLFRYDASDTTTADNSGTVIVDVAGNRWKRQWSGPLDVRFFGARADDTDPSGATTAALAAVRTWAAAQSSPPHIYFPPGAYRYATSPNWAIGGLLLDFAPGVTLTCTGAGNAVDIDAGASAWIINVSVRGWPLARCGPTAGHAWFLRGLAGGTMEIRASGANTTLPAIECQQIVSLVFNRPTVNHNHQAWYNPSGTPAKPASCMRITRRGTDPATGDSGYPLLEYPDFAGPDVGLDLDYVVGVGVVGGAMQGLAVAGYRDTVRTRLTRMFHVDFEANATRDVDAYGYGNEWHGCHFETLVTFRNGGSRSKIIAGEAKAIAIESGYLDATLTAVTYDFFSTGATVVDNGTRTCRRDLLNISATNSRDNARPADITVVPGGVDYFLTNVTGNDLHVRKIGGTQTFFGLNGNAVGQDAGQVTLRPEDTLSIISISVAPTIIISGE